MALSAEYYEWWGPECGCDALLAEADEALDELRAAGFEVKLF
mgnify:CR=1 FL=1